MWEARICAAGSTHCLAVRGNFKLSVLVPAAAALYQNGKVTATRNSDSPARMTGRSRMIALRERSERLATQVGGPLLLAAHHERIAEQFVYAGHFHAGHPILEQRREGGFVDRADACQQAHAELFFHVLDGIGARETAAHAHLEVLVRAQSGSAAAAERLLADGVLRHLVELRAHVAQDIAGF